MRITFSKTLLLATTAFSMISVPAANAYLSPLSFNEMYAHASRGNLTVLNNAILRGMNINAVNGDGDTGICVAIRRGDHIAYESFRNTGAHTYPRCLNNINAKQYKKFMADTGLMNWLTEKKAVQSGGGSAARRPSAECCFRQPFT